MGNFDFDLDLRDGQEGEQDLLRMLQTVEVKRDHHVGKTGNVFVEYESRGKPSGIKTSKSEYWAFLFDCPKFKEEVVVIIKTERLRFLLRECYKAKIGRITSGGDNRTSLGYLLPVEKLLSANG